MPWLMKAEPDTRLEKGIDVKFSIDDFEAMGVSKWDGVRNHEAKKIMKEKMEEGDQVLFYHSNCKVPGVYGTAVVHKEGYPDFTAWDSTHPYYDAKSKQDAPTWFMVDVEFKSRLDHPVTLALLKYLAGQQELPECVSYIGDQGHKSIKEMTLVNRGRLSVQPVTPEAYEATLLLGENGGWDELIAPVRKAAAKKAVKPKASPKSKRKAPQEGEPQEQLINGQTTSENDDALTKKRKRVATKSSKTSGRKIKRSSSRSSSELSDILSLMDSQGRLPAESLDDIPTTDHEPPMKQKRLTSKNSNTSPGTIELASSRRSPSEPSSSELSDLLEHMDTEIDTLEERKAAVLMRGKKRLPREEIASGRYPTIEPYRRSARLQRTTSD